MAESVKHQVLGFKSGRDLGVVGLSPEWDPCSVCNLLKILSPSRLPLPLMFSVSKINK